MAFERHRDTKRLRYRGPRGRFSRPPSLESAGVIWICERSDCGGINVTESHPGRCGHCGSDRKGR